MKTKIILLTLAATLLTIFNCSAQSAYKVFAGGTTALGGTNAFACVSANSYNNGTPLVTYLNATSDLSTSKVQFYTVSGWADCQLTNSTTTLYATTNAFMTANTVCVLRHMATDTYEKLYAASVANTNQITVRYAPVSAALPGDRLYALTAAGTIPVGATTLSLTGPGIYSGQATYPLFMEITGTSSCSINAVCATYQ